jgi:pilus assembly protein CpaF
MRFGFTPKPDKAAEPESPGTPGEDVVDADVLYRDLISQKPALLDEKVKLHGRIIDEFNLPALDKAPREELRREIQDYVTAHVRNEKIALNHSEVIAFAEEILDEMTGLGPIEPLLKDPTVADILINTHEQRLCRALRGLEPTSIRFKDEAHLLRIINKIVAGVGRRIDESTPMVDARLPDGSRVNVAIRPVAVDGPLVSIRKFSKKPFSMERLVESARWRPPIGNCCRAAVRGRASRWSSPAAPVRARRPCSTPCRR